ncbi:MAG: signal peptidase II [Acidimicrobiales bacterium]
MPRQRLVDRLNLAVIVIALVVTAIDALSKVWARHVLATHAIHVGGAIWLRLEYNSGISFSFVQSRALITSIVTAVVVIVVLLVGLRANRGLSTVGFGLLIGGGIANVIDRLSATPHRVTDFIALGSFSVFNLADVAITAGFITLLVGALMGEKLLA